MRSQLGINLDIQPIRTFNISDTRVKALIYVMKSSE